ncbi:hypothetical protein N9D62_06140 [Amylibacter sp.]|nr:hypothetical protein [Amylibacter sp.]
MQNVVTKISVNTARDYFQRLGGSGVYQGFQDWHPDLLTVACALQATGRYSYDALLPLWLRLPMRIIHDCDGLREKLTSELSNQLATIDNQSRLIKLAITEISNTLERHYGIDQKKSFEQNLTEAIDVIGIVELK